MLETIALDLIGAGCLLLCWVGYTIFSDKGGFSNDNLIASVAKHRKLWVAQMLARDNRVVDIQVLKSLMDVGRFLASTSILVVAGLLAVLGATDQAISLVMELPFAAPVNRGIWEGKVIFVILIFVYAFFKFMWSMRQYTYCTVMVGAAPPASDETMDKGVVIDSIAQIASLAAKHSNHGTRAYYFGLATLSWFIHPILLIPASLWVVVVLYRREFRSRTLAHIRMSQGDNIGDGRI